MRRYKSITGFALVLLLLAVLNMPRTGGAGMAKAVIREAVAPLQSLVSGVIHRVREAYRTLAGLGGLAVENRRLAMEMAQLRTQIIDLKAQGYENTALREQLRFVRRSNRRLLPCEVIARDAGSWWQTVRVDKGTKEGLLPNMAVLSSQGLVGRTVEVSPNTSEVLLISDASSRLSAQILRTGSFGVLQGRGQRAGQALCVMEFINKNTAIRPGDEVVTSGLGGTFPRGLLVGYVDAVRPDPSGLYQTTDVIPVADLGRLEYVFAVLEGDRATPDKFMRTTGEDRP